MQRFLTSRLDVQTRLWGRLREVPDLQAAWLLLLYCAVPRANHLLRAVPPDMVAEYARAHDDGIWATFLDLIGYDRRPANYDQFPLDRDILGKGSGKGSAHSSNVPHHREEHRVLESTEQPREDAAEVEAEQAAGGRGAAQRLPSEFEPSLGSDPGPGPARKIAFLPIVHGRRRVRSPALPARWGGSQSRAGRRGLCRLPRASYGRELMI